MPADDVPGRQDAIRATPIFADLDERALQVLASESQWKRVAGGDALFRQGDAGDAVHVVIAGRLRAFVDGESGHRAIGDVGRGETVGEMAVIAGGPQPETVLAVRDSLLIEIGREAFERIVERSPRAMLAIARELVNRLRDSAGGRRPVVSTIAVAAAGRGRPVADFAGQLAHALGRHAKLVTSADVAALGDGDELTGWLDRHELLHGHVVYAADPDLTPWTRRCLRQADCVLLVGWSDADPEPSPIEAALPARTADAPHRELALVHEDREKLYRGTAAWLSGRTVDTHHHLHARSHADFARLARRIGGHAVGLVLGGGGARGFAHIGFIRAVREAGIPIDAAGGTSMGSIIGAQLALGWDEDEMLRANRKGFIEVDPLRAYTAPLTGVMSDRKFRSMLASMYGDARIEDLPLPYFAVSCNLSRAEIVVHREGPVHRAVRTSGSLPGVVPPMCADGDLLVDGGVLNNLPVDIMRDSGAGVVIAHDVSPTRELHVERTLDVAPNGPMSLWRQMRRRAAPVPTVMAIMARTAILGSVHASHEVRRRADLYLHPPIEQYGIFEWRSMERLVEIGYEHARREIAAWRGRE